MGVVAPGEADKRGNNHSINLNESTTSGSLDKNTAIKIMCLKNGLFWLKK
jgi:hypothetical protein